VRYSGKWTLRSQCIILILVAGKREDSAVIGGPYALQRPDGDAGGSSTRVQKSPPIDEDLDALLSGEKNLASTLDALEENDPPSVERQCSSSSGQGSWDLAAATCNAK
jgi:hypothetical protein